MTTSATVRARRSAGAWRAVRVATELPPRVADLGLAVLCWLAFTLPVTLGVDADANDPRWAVALLGAAAVAPLIVRREHPIACALAVTAVLVAAELASVRFTPFVSNAGPAFGIAVYSLAAHVERRVSLPVTVLLAALTWAATGVAFALHTGQDHDAVQLVIGILAWVVGELVRLRRHDAAALAEERQRQAAEHDARVRAEERLALSRDVHDIVSHNLSAIAVQAGVARLLIAEQPTQGAEALAAIETTGRAALDELRTLLHEIREPGSAGPGAAASLADLPDIVARMRTARLDVQYETRGAPGTYGEAVQTALVRIAQEALTNVVKHADAARASVTLEHGVAEVVLTVTDDGHGGDDAPTPGIGLTGMRERAALLGGTLTAGPVPTGGFRVGVRLPIRADRSAK